MELRMEGMLAYALRRVSEQAEAAIGAARGPSKIERRALAWRAEGVPVEEIGRRLNGRTARSVGRLLRAAERRVVAA